jgi:alkylhydroperoxidase family enzyme
MLICRVAVLNEADFEWDHHAPILVKAGFPAESLEVLKAPDLEQQLSSTTTGSGSSFKLSSKDLAALLYTDEMTKNVKVASSTFRRLQGHFNHREIVEITATIGAYNCVSRFLVALDVDERGNAEDDTVSTQL